MCGSLASFTFFHVVLCAPSFIVGHPCAAPEAQINLLQKMTWSWMFPMFSYLAFEFTKADGHCHAVEDVEFAGLEAPTKTGNQSTSLESVGSYLEWS